MAERAAARAIYGETFRAVRCPWVPTHEAAEVTKVYKRHLLVWIECYACEKSDFQRKVKK